MGYSSAGQDPPGGAATPRQTQENGMDVYVVSGFGVKPVPVEELGDLLAQRDVLVWVDIPRCDGKTAMVLSETFGFHDIAIRDCVERNHISKLHVYDDHVFTVLHAPETARDVHPQVGCRIQEAAPANSRRFSPVS